MRDTRLRAATALIASAATVVPALTMLVPAAARSLVPSSASTSSTRTAASVLAAMTLPQEVGQLFMVGTPANAVDPHTVSDITRFHAGGVLLNQRSYAGVAATRRLTNSLQARATRSATAGVGLLMATDQEGGYVQVLNGPGFATMPTALTQGTWLPAHLHAAAQAWGDELARAGVNVDLAPVMDTVPSAAFAPHNAPIGYWKREFGFTPRRVANHGVAVVRAYAGDGVSPTIKHFPGLGRVTGNTDFSSGVTDHVTTRTSSYLNPFAKAIKTGRVPIVMMSLAYYSKIDPANPAAFSPTVIGSILRQQLGFHGVVMSDSLGATQVSGWPLGVRADKFLRAGGDLVLDADPQQMPAMYHAVLARTRAVPSFREKVDAAALAILRLKQAKGLLGR